MTKAEARAKYQWLPPAGDWMYADVDTVSQIEDRVTNLEQATGGVTPEQVAQTVLDVVDPKLSLKADQTSVDTINSTITSIQSDVANKQNELLAGNNITIDQDTNTISSSVDLSPYAEKSYVDSSVSGLVNELGVQTYLDNHDYTTNAATDAKLDNYVQKTQFATQLNTALNAGSGITINSDNTIAVDTTALGLDTKIFQMTGNHLSELSPSEDLIYINFNDSGEYVYLNGYNGATTDPTLSTSWLKIGEVGLDLSEYLTDTQIETKINNKLSDLENTSNLDSILTAKAFITNSDLGGLVTTEDLVGYNYASKEFVSASGYATMANVDQLYVNKNEFGVEIAGLQPEITGAVSNVTNVNLPANKIVSTDANGKLTTTSVDLTTLNTSTAAVPTMQTQISNMQSTVSGLSSSISAGVGFSKDWAIGYDGYDRAFSAGSNANPTPITFYYIKAPTGGSISLDGSVVIGPGSGGLKVTKAGVYIATAYVNTYNHSSDAYFMVQINGESNVGVSTAKFQMSSSLIYTEHTCVLQIPANAIVRLALLSNQNITTSVNLSGLNPSVSCSLSLARIA